MARSTLRPVSCASQGRVVVDRVAGLLLGVEAPTVSLKGAAPRGVALSDGTADDAALRSARRDRIRLARSVRARRRERIIVRRTF
jgi:hypothetical protein